MESRFEIEVQGRRFGADTWKAMALAIAAAFNAPELAGGSTCPTFVLRADRISKGHLGALIAGYDELRNTGHMETVRAMESAIREFELWEEAHR